MTTKNRKIAKTLNIAGHTVTLKRGRDYIASRPMADRGDRQFDVTIKAKDGAIAHVIRDLSYDEANAFLAEFNNGPTSFHGRTW